MYKSLIERLFPFLFLDTPDATGGAGGIGAVSDFSQDMKDLNDADNEAEDEGEEEGDPIVSGDDLPNEEDDEDDGEKEGEEQEEEPEERTEEEDEKEDKEDKAKKPIVPIEGRPTIKQLKEIAPDIFKRAPELKAIYFREQQFSEHFGTPEEAGQAVVKAANFDTLEDSLVAGNPKILMGELLAGNPQAFKEVAKNWLPELRELDPDLYSRVTAPIIEDLLYFMGKAAEKQGDKNLMNVARHVANFVFANGGELPKAASTESRAQKHPAEEALNRERAAHAERAFKEADSYVVEKIGRSLEASILNGLDPKNELSKRVKAGIVRDVRDDINQTLLKDTAHGRRMGGLWQVAKRSGFSQQAKDSIVNGYLSAVRPLLRAARNRVREEYLGKSPAGNNAGGDKDKGKKRGVFAGNRSAGISGKQNRGRVLDPSKIDYSRTSDMDIINDTGGDRVKFRK